MTDYPTITTLDDWPDDIVLIQVGGGPGCIVREPHRRTIPEIWTSFDEAKALAESYVADKPWLKGIMIYEYI